METIHGLNTNGPAIIGTGVAFAVLTVLSVGLRFSAKRLAHNPLGLDDWLLLFALLCFFTTEVLVVSVFYFTVISLVQVSILLFYRRIFFPSSFRWTSAALIAISTSWFVAGIVIEIGYPGRPIAYWFPGSSTTVFNVNYLTFWLIMGIIEVTLELIILILPIRELYQLQLSAEKKALCSMIFALGSFVIITGIIRLIKVYKPSGTDVDLTQGQIWLNVHLGTAIICACLPTLRPLVTRNPWISRNFSSRRSKQHSIDTNDTYKLPSLPKGTYQGESSEIMTTVYDGNQQQLHGNFCNARRSESSGVTKAGSGEDSPVRTGEAIRIKQSVEVV
ncbi:MAG: hypothetical protein Q9219_001545 [cf. Caloplaca sp. 3 TL-2023]